MLPAEITKVIEIIDQRIEAMKSNIEALSNARAQLVQLFDKSTHSEVSATTTIRRFPRLRENPPRNGSERLTRKDEIANFLKTHGPVTRAELISGTQLPVGTVGFCLNDKKRFVNHGGKWSLIQS